MKLSFKSVSYNFIIFFLSLFLFIVGNYYIYSKLIKVSDVINPYLFLFILNVDVVFFIIIFAYTLRYLIKILFEEFREGKLKIKLTLIFISIVVIPSLILFIASMSIISSATNLWFSGKVGEALGKLDNIVVQNIESNKDWLLKVFNLLDNGNISPKEAVEILGLKTASIYDQDGRLIEFYGSPYDKEVFNTLYKEGFSFYENKIVLNKQLKDGKKVILVYEFPKYLYLSKQDTSLILKVYNELKYYKSPIRIGYILILLTITIFIIFSTIWFSRYIVRNITNPVEALVEVAKRLSEGDLSVRINIKSNDEFGILISEFNRMVDRLNLLYKKLEDRNLILKRNKEYLEAILNNINAGVIYSNEDGIIENMNKSAIDILSEKVTEFLRKDIESLANFLGINLSENKEQIISYNNKTLLFKIKNIKGKGYVIIFDDITNIIHAQKLQMWKEVAQRIAHEIKNPLTPIKLAAERIIRSYKKENPNFSEILESSINIIISETDHLTNLVREFNQFGNTLSHLNYEDINICQLLKEISDSYNSTNFKVILNCNDNFIIKGDKKLLKQAFANIVQNSFEEATQLNINLDKSNDRIVLVFKDNGKGIEMKDIDKIFLPYFSKKPKGSGLGLSITKEIIEKHNGTIKAIPSDNGAEFIIELKIS